MFVILDSQTHNGAREKGETMIEGPSHRRQRFMSSCSHSRQNHVAPLFTGSLFTKNSGTNPNNIAFPWVRCFPRQDKGMTHVPLHLIGVAFHLGEVGHQPQIRTSRSPQLGHYSVGLKLSLTTLSSIKCKKITWGQLG